MSRAAEAHKVETEQEIGKPLPACFECGTPRPLLWSYASKGQFVGRALCEHCLERAIADDGEAR
jgi:hypothetical protein